MFVAATWVYTVFGGTLSIGHDPTVNQPQIVLVDGYLGINPGLGWVYANPPYQVYLGHVLIPLPAVVIVLAIPAAGLWLFGRKPIAPGRCSNCGYNLTGNVSGVCPECGEKA